MRAKMWVGRLARFGLVAGLGALPGCASQPPLGYYGSVYREYPRPGAPRTPVQIYRRLVADGYDLHTPPQQQGPVYFVGAYKRRQPLCLIVEAFNGAILQTFSYRKGDRIVAHNRNTPGPGFPGDPPFVDGRYAAPMCPPYPDGSPEIIGASPYVGAQWRPAPSQEGL